MTVQTQNSNIIEIPSSGRKWRISNKLMESLKANVEEPNRFGETYFDLCLPGMVVRVCYRRDDFITAEGDDGYIGLSRHSDGWHIGTPNFAMSTKLIDAMKKLKNGRRR